jgi:AcrR family transcriptional regulator
MVMTGLPQIGARPRQARSAATRERYYEATMRRFVSDGVEGTRVEDVVADVGGSWGAYHHYFPRKEDVLLERTVRELRETIKPRVEAALSDRRTSIRKAVEDVFVGLASSELPRHVHGAVMREVSAHPQRLAEMLDEGEMPVVGYVAALLRAGQERGEVHTEVDPFSLAGVLSGGTMFPVIQTAYGPPLRGLEGVVQPPEPADAVRRILAIAWRAVAA